MLPQPPFGGGSLPPPQWRTYSTATAIQARKPGLKSDQPLYLYSRKRGQNGRTCMYTLCSDLRGRIGHCDTLLFGIRNTSVQQRLVKTGGRLVKHARYHWLLLAESHLTRRLFGAMLRRIWALPIPAS